MNRTEIAEKVKTFAREWWDNLGDYPWFNFASFCAGIVFYIVVRFFVK